MKQMPVLSGLSNTGSPPRRGAVGVVVLFLPVAEEQPLHLPSGLPQQQRRDGGIHAAGEPDDDAGGGAGRCGHEGHARIVMLRNTTPVALLSDPLAAPGL